MTSQLSHPILGCVTGISKNGVVQYKGVPYATLKNNFSDAELFDNPGGKTIDATKSGPAAIHPSSARETEYKIIQHSLPGPDVQCSGTECLNLNITVPDGDHKDLPVFIYLHGGGLAIGSNAWPQYDMARIVKLSSELGSPVIGVNINYRLGVTGFLTSEELRSAGFKANNGLRDQKVAFQWVQRYISGFGGNPREVTAVGESAGAVSCLLHLQSTEPLFQRVVSMSGTPLLMKTLAPADAEFAYSSVLQSLEITAASPGERIRALLNTTPEAILSKISPAVPLLAIVDDDLIKYHGSFTDIPSQYPGAKWCKDLLIGDCQFDSSVLLYMLFPRLEGIEKAFVKSVSTSLGEDSSARESLLKAYSITGSKSDSSVNDILKFANDIGFYAPILEIAKAWPSTVYLYHFNEPNPWDGPWKGEANHVFDVALLFQNYNEYLSEEQQALGKQFASQFIAFVNGQPPFPAFSPEDGGAMVYGPTTQGESAAFVQGGGSERYGRRSTIYDLAKSTGGLERLSQVWGEFMAGH